MGGFANVLGHAAAGFEQARQQDLTRQFSDEQNRRAMAGELMGKIIMDPNQPAEVRTAFTQAYLGMSNQPFNKPFNFQKQIGPLFELMAKYRAAGQQAAPQVATPPAPPGLAAPAAQPAQPGGTPSNAFPGASMLPQGVPPPPPPPAGQPGMAPTPQATAGATMAAASPAGGPPTPAQAGAPQEFLAGPETIARNAGLYAGAQARGTLEGQIAARQFYLDKIPGLTPEVKAALMMGMPAMVGSYGRGDIIPVSEAARTGIPLPANMDPNDWVRVQRGKAGNIVGVFPAATPPAYAPTVHEGFVQVQQLDGSIQEVPITSTTRKQIPGTEAPTAKVGQGKTVGGKAPAPQLMITPPSTPGGQPQAVAVKPGGKVPTGAVTPSGYSQISVPTSGTRTRSEFATGLIPHVDQAISDVQAAAPKLGALKGRWNEFVAGTLGGGLDDDPQISALRTEIGLLQTGMMVPHVGARGGVQLIAKFKNLIDSGKASAPQLTASLKEMRSFLTTYANEGKLKGWGNEQMEQPGVAGPPPPPFDWNAHPVIK